MMDAPGDAERRVALRRMRLVATGLLVAAALLYLLTLRETRHGWLGWVNAGSEAAMGAWIGDLVPEKAAEFIRGGIERA